MNNTPHPLQDIALRAFAESAAQDRSTLALFMAGATSVRSATGAQYMRAYRDVAMDVLGYMEAQGVLARDRDGWYRLRQRSGG